jgi:hypothetical protein
MHISLNERLGEASYHEEAFQGLVREDSKV